MRWAIAMLAALLLAGCAGPPQGSAGPDPPRPLTFQPLYECSGAQETELSLVVNTQQRWEELWRDACVNPAVIGGESAQPPAVDFARNSVVASFWGEKNKGGYGMEIAAVEDHGDKVVVKVRRIAPTPECNVIQVITYPAALAVSEKVTKRAEFTFVDITGCA